MRKASVGVVFLARHADGIPAIRRFADSYRRHPAGIAHELIVIYKGFEQQNDLQDAQAVFHDLPHQGVELPDVGFDIGAYLETSRRVAHEYLLFFNTHSGIAAPEWLAALFNCIAHERVGVAGAMGSYESIQDTVLVLRSAIWESIGVGSSYDEKLAFYFGFVLQQHHPDWYAPSGEPFPPPARSRGLFRKATIACARAMRKRWFVQGGTGLIWVGAPPFDYMQFPTFPNPHIRSNGFMMRRELLLNLELEAISTKMDTSLFESGKNSLTARIRRSGLAAVVVGRDGVGHDVPDWWRSGTFRLGGQDNLLATDNHTRAFDSMSKGARAAHARMTWGDFLGPAPEDFPDLGRNFRRTTLPTPTY